MSRRSAMLLAALASALALPALAHAQASLGASGYSQNFNAFPTSGSVAHLAGWSTIQFAFGDNNTWGVLGAAAIPASGTSSVASGTTSGTQTVSAQVGSAATNSSSTARNFGSTSTDTNRALGLAPTSSAGLALQLSLTNSTGSPITGITIAYDIRRFTAPTTANELPGYWLFYSLDAGATWINASALNPTLSGPGGVIVPNSIGVTTVPATTITFPAALASGGNLRLRFVDDNADQSSPDQIYGLDNLVITGIAGSLDGRCCSPIDGSCTLTTTGACPAGQTFTPSGVCDPNTCPPPPSGSCCNPDSACTVTVQTACPAGSAWTVAGVCTPNTCPALLAPLTASGYAQNFNAAFDAAPTALPPGFSMWTVAGDRPTFEEIASGGTGLIDAPAVATATLVSGAPAVFNQSGTTAPATRNAGYNFGFAADPGNRLLGVSPTSNGASFIQLRLRNDTGAPVTSLTFTYDFRVMSDWTANELAGYRFFYSTSGPSGPWTPVPALDGVATSTAPTGTTIAESAVITFSAPVADGAEILFRWGDDNGNASPDQAYAIDNLSILPGSGPVQVCCAPDGSCVIQPQGAACSGAIDPVATTCDPNPCPQPPSGTCCAIDGSCTFVRQSVCIGGVWTVGGACSPNPCPGPVVACCLPDGSCVSLPQDQCTTGFSAGPVPCSTVALCRQPGVTRFVVIGDYGVDNANQLAVANRLKRYNPAFIATTGDNTYFTNADITNWDRTQAKFYREFIKLPAASAFFPGAAVNEFFPIMGNHDFDVSGSTAGALASWNAYWELPGNERTYTFTRGPIDFFMLSSDGREPDGDTVGSVQHQWFVQANAASTAQWKLAFFHHPAYTYPSNHSADLAMRAWNFGAAGIHAVFNGHNHNLQRIEAEGIPFIVSGAGGNSLYAINGTVAGGAFAASVFGFHLVDATPEQLVIRAIDVNGVLLDSRTITAPTGACCNPDGSCSTTVRTLCSGVYQGDASACSPNPCPQPAGACCRGATCAVVNQADCSGPNTNFRGVNTACNLPGNALTPCCRADFNQNGTVNIDDIFIFLNVWFSTTNAAADANENTIVNIDDIFIFLNLWFAGCN